jgi:TolB-like protein
MTHTRPIHLLTPILIAATLLVVEAPADNRAVRTAVFDFVAENYPEPDALSLSQRLRSELSTLEQFAVLPHLDQHPSRSAAECRTTACIARVGRALEADRAVSGRVERTDPRHLRIQAQLIDVDDEVILRTVTRTVEDDLENLLQKEMPDLARQLAGIRRKKSNATLWLFLAGGAGTAAYLFTRDDNGNEPPDENGSAEITGTFPPPR